MLDDEPNITRILFFIAEPCISWHFNIDLPHPRLGGNTPRIHRFTLLSTVFHVEAFYLIGLIRPISDASRALAVEHISRTWASTLALCSSVP
jgi:hypothetical protein